MSILATPRSAGSVTSITVSTSYTDKFYDAKQESKSIGLLVQGIVDITVLQASTYPVNITDGKSFSLSVKHNQSGDIQRQRHAHHPRGDRSPCSQDQREAICW
jgi:hypothetical protein